ncbi:helix-turn-helix domain-containing protein [Paraburkholderia phenazinium]|jgi:transcriptional regulator with XRE-family HTH domain|uniref:Helix-turn-helix n=1 Tax=Paraburkholderia phenazinium TaxID=60549 RepID=A0A1G7ZT34_9BURK|nr:helix-turn-helix transcriptional regulator [Paraburkholderia phenazinium]SDH11849.1 Helix-turn-helix [Paraburkholderia phenazinium]
MLLFDLATADEIARELGQRLRTQRLAQNLQQSELAARAGVSERAVRNLERTGKATLESLLRVAMALGLAGSLSPLFEYRPNSIRAMENANDIRERASRR